ncbi:cytochrome P450 71D9 isoform X2 [Arachis duranensis]|uniref:Cytochrome P450 71D9 isoform X2 n=1 Tax=Arachis duranensis TaxID=130453 RepID=A0A9C6WR69_ARADU|nr:cytochrome P450 71D9 isoform X2 [Arachis duranensis]
MDSQIFNFLAFIFFLFFIIAALRIRKKSDVIPNIPPGPWKLPIIGNIPNLVTSTPHRKLRDLANKYGPLMHLQLGQVSTIVVSSAEYAKEVMKTHDIIFASRPAVLAAKIISYDCTNIGFAPYGNYWRQLRKICTLELLSTKRVNSFRPIREEEFTNLVKRIMSSKEGSVNLTEEVLSSIYGIVSQSAFGGTKRGDQEKFICLVQQATAVAGGFDVGDLFPSWEWLQLVSGLRPKLESFQRQIDEILENIVSDHKEAKLEGKKSKSDESHEDLVDVLLQFEDATNQDICLSRNNIKAILLDIFGGGSETSAHTIDWAMTEMIRDPGVMEKAQAEIRELFNRIGKVDETLINELKYLKSVVKETLRLHPPAPLLLPRECGEACEINGYYIPYKSKVIVNAWAIGRDPKNWSEPEKFYPERFIDSDIDYKGNNFEFVPFGAGRRTCPGSTLGLLNVELALAYLLYHFDWKLPSGMKHEELDMSEAFGVAVRRKKDLQLVPIVFSPLLET